jgi:hypothetical protein
MRIITWNFPWREILIPVNRHLFLRILVIQNFCTFFALLNFNFWRQAQIEQLRLNVRHYPEFSIICNYFCSNNYKKYCKICIGSIICFDLFINPMWVAKTDWADLKIKTIRSTNEHFEFEVHRWPDFFTELFLNLKRHIVSCPGIGTYSCLQTPPQLRAWILLIVHCWTNTDRSRQSSNRTEYFFLFESHYFIVLQSEM